MKAILSAPLFKAFFNKQELLEGQPETTHNRRGGDSSKMSPLSYEVVMGGFLVDHDTAGITSIAEDRKSGGIRAQVNPEYARPDEVLKKLEAAGIAVVSLVGPSWAKVGKQGRGEKVTLADARKFVADLMEDQSNLTVAKGASGEGSRGGKVIRHTKSGKPIYSGAAEKQAMQADRMMVNWHDRAQKTNNPEDHAVAAKQALASAFYHHHNDDTMAAHQSVDYANHHRKKYEKQGHTSRTTKWIEKNHKNIANLVGHKGYDPEDYK